jgi:hypothetical protein
MSCFQWIQTRRWGKPLLISDGKAQLITCISTGWSGSI